VPAPATAPAFATDATYAADGDPWSGDATKVDPGATIRAEGYEPDLLPAPWLNFQLGLFGEWLTYLRTWINESTEEFKYPTTKSRTRSISGADMLTIGAMGTDWLPNLSSGVRYLQPLVNGALAVIPIDIPSGCTVNAVDVLVKSSGVRVTPNGWFVKVYEQSENWTTPAHPTATQQGSTTEGGLATGHSVIAVGPLTPFIRVNGYTAHVIVTGPTGALGSDDRLLAVRVSFTDGGPRNA
jgi:hypothetical protein